MGGSQAFQAVEVRDPDFVTRTATGVAEILAEEGHDPRINLDGRGCPSIRACEEPVVHGRGSGMVRSRLR
jgi:hypothetical protein